MTIQLSENWERRGKSGKKGKMAEIRTKKTKTKTKTHTFAPPTCHVTSGAWPADLWHVPSVS